MDKQTKVILAARCGAAARGGINEDNCLILSTVGKPSTKINHFGDGDYLSEVISLSQKGCLLVVADGMGGMNAGEVASKIAVDTIAHAFQDERVSKMEMTDSNARKLMRKAILEADNAIRKAAAADKEKEGMGTTVVMLWVVNNKAYYGWCGDSRIYRYNSGVLDQLSSDHSYVVEVLHLSEEAAFTHPNNNIITRCLGNPDEQAVPEILQPEPLTQGDLFLLCSDGFCGIIRNSEIVDLLQEVAEKPEKLNEGLDLLWKSAEEHHWHDNMTTLLCYVKSGPEKKEVPVKSAIAAQTIDPASSPNVGGKRKGTMIAIIAGVVLVIAALVAALLFFQPFKKTEPIPEEPAVDTTIAVVDSLPMAEENYEYEQNTGNKPAEVTQKPDAEQNKVPGGISDIIKNHPSKTDSRDSNSTQEQQSEGK